MHPFASRSRTARAWVGVALVGVALGLAGCEATVDPGPGIDRPFTLYGFIDPSASSQRVRVIEIQRTLTPETAEPIDATVTSTDLADGSRVTWRDSVVTFSDGATGHVYTAPFQADYGTAYRIQATRSDGAASTVEVRVPQRATLTEGSAPPDTVIVDRGTPNAPDLDTTIVVATPVTIPFDLRGEVSRLLDVRMRYLVSVPDRNLGETAVDIAYETGEDALFVRQVDGGWAIQVNLGADQTDVRRRLASAVPTVMFSDRATYHGATLLLFIADEAWVSPTGVFDPDALIEPGTFSNVDNGFGFVGAGYTLRHDLTAPDSVVTEAGFELPD